jgi:hypothetical protein
MELVEGIAVEQNKTTVLLVNSLKAIGQLRRDRAEQSSMRISNAHSIEFRVGSLVFIRTDRRFFEVFT